MISRSYDVERTALFRSSGPWSARTSSMTPMSEPSAPTQSNPSMVQLSGRFVGLSVITVLAILTASCTNASESEPEGIDSPPTESVSYDMGWGYGQAELCNGFEVIFGTPDAGDAAGSAVSEAIVDRWNGYVIRTINESSLESLVDPLMFLSGMWDGATTACTDWFPNAKIAGRPGGREVESEPWVKSCGTTA